ncbi:hypothetical protein EG329_010384 [Mollisiaceae sp. DMI_Dod_QoI]|nr:hypothetical protein EG329_010384 [Helotiales sp. DMI_Dod_QoI]
MDHYDEPESQVLPETYVHVDQHPHIDHLLASNGEGQVDEAHYNAQDHTQDSSTLVVKDTQFAQLETDTQANQESIEACVKETQFADIEPDTQVADGSVAAPASKAPLLDDIAKGTAKPTQYDSSPLFKRPKLPSLETATTSFKYGAQFRTQNYMRPTPKYSTALVDMKTANVPKLGLASIPQPDVPCGTPLANPETTPTPFTSTEKCDADSSDTNINIRQAADSWSHKMTSEVFQHSAHNAESTHLDAINHQNSHHREGSKSAGPGPDINPSQMPINGSDFSPHAAQSRPVRRQRIKQPFPEATTPEESRRWRDKASAKSRASSSCSNVGDIRSGTPSNTGRTRTPARDDVPIDKPSRSHEHSMSVVNISYNHTDTPHQIDMEVDPLANFVPEYYDDMNEAISSPSRAVWETENDNSAFEIVNERDLNPASTEPENNINTIAQSSLDAKSLLPSNSGLLADHRDANMPRNATSKDATEGREQSRQTSPIQSDSIPNIAARASALQLTTRPPPQAQLETESRPQSRRSDCSKPMSRPISQHELKPLQQTIPHHATKVKKSKASKQSTAADQPHSPQEGPTPFKLLIELNRHSSDILFEAYMKQESLIQKQQERLEQQDLLIKSKEEEFRLQNKRIEEQQTSIKSLEEEIQLRDKHIEEQQTSINSQEEEIRLQGEHIEKRETFIKSQQEDFTRLKTSADFSKKRIEELENEKTTYKEQVRKCQEKGVSYAKHANEVVKAQKWLKGEAEALRKRTTDMLGVYLDRDKASAELENGLENGLKRFEDLRLEIQDLKAVSKELLAEKKNHEHNLKTLKTQFSKEKVILEAENATLKVEGEKAVKNCELLQSTLDQRLKDLATEKHNTEQLQKNLNEQTATWNQLLETVKHVPHEISKTLESDGSTLARILTSESTTRESIEEMALSVREHLKREPELPLALSNLLEGVASKLEGEQASNNNHKSLRDAVTTLQQDLKEGMSQVRLDKDLEIRLNSKISELQQAREQLDADKVARDIKIEDLLKQLEESRKELENLRRDLSTKNNELAAALSILREEPALRSKIGALEKANDVLDNQAKETNQELLKAREELVTAGKDSESKDEQIKYLTEKNNELMQTNNKLTQENNNAQETIEKCTENTKKKLAVKEEEHKKICQDLVRNAESQRVKLKTALESEIKILEKRVEDKDTEMTFMKEQLQNLQAKARLLENTEPEPELSAYKEQMMQLSAAFKRLEQDEPSTLDDNEFSQDLRAVQDEMAELRLLFHSIATKTTEDIEAAAGEQRAIEETLRKIDDLQKEKMAAEEGNISLQVHADHFQLHQLERGAVSHSSRRPEVSSVALMSLRDPNRLLAQKHAAFAVPSSIQQANLEDDMLLEDVVVHSPQNALRHATRKVGSSTSQSRFGEKATGSVIPTSTRVETYETLALNDTVERTTHAGDPSKSALRHQEPTSCSLRVAPRKSNWAGMSVQYEKQTGQSSVPGIVTPRGSGNEHGHTSYNLFSDLTSIGQESSPLTSIERMFDHLDSMQNEKQLREEGDNTGSKNDTALAAAETILMQQTTLGIEKQGSVTEEVRVGNQRQTSTIKVQNNAPSKAEESLRRRNSQPAKSALKRTTRHTALVPEQVHTLEGDVHTAQPNGLIGSESMRPPQSSDRPLNSIKGLVSGKSARSLMVTGAPASSLMQSTPASSHFFDLQQSPPMDAPRRNRNKRPTSTVLESRKSKAPRFQLEPRFSSKSVIPDSQETQKDI